MSPTDTTSEWGFYGLFIEANPLQMPPVRMKSRWFGDQLGDKCDVLGLSPILVSHIHMNMILWLGLRGREAAINEVHAIVKVWSRRGAAEHVSLILGRWRAQLHAQME